MPKIHTWGSAAGDGRPCTRGNGPQGIPVKEEWGRAGSLPPPLPKSPHSGPECLEQMVRNTLQCSEPLKTGLRVGGRGARSSRRTSGTTQNLSPPPPQGWRCEAQRLLNIPALLRPRQIPATKMPDWFQLGLKKRLKELRVGVFLLIFFFLQEE